MSRYISPGSPAEHDAAQPIVHFDATEQRKQKMRQAAEQRRTSGPAMNAHDPGPTRAGAAPEKHGPDPARVSPNGVPSELNAFLTELHQYLDESPANSIARFPILSRVAAFLHEARSPARKENGLVAEDENAETTIQSKTALFETGQDLLAEPASDPESGEEADARRAVLARPQALEAFMIDFVVEQTGYPREVVELDADLEADLGIDSIKKAQLFAELRDYFDINPNVTQKDLTLDDFPTLRHVVNFIQNAAPEVVSPETGEPVAGNDGIQRRIGLEATLETGTDAATDAPTASVEREASEFELGEEFKKTRAVLEDPEALEAFMIDFVVEQTGYPREVVELDADLEADLGIDSIKKAQLFAELRDYFDINPNITQKDLTLDDFPTLRHVVNFIQNAESTAGQEPARAGVAAPSAITGDGARSPGETGENLPESTPGPVMNALARLMVETGVVEAPVPRLTGDTRLIDDLGLDSVMILKLATAVERELGITLNLDELRLNVLNSAGAFASLIERRLALQQ